MEILLGDFLKLNNRQLYKSINIEDYSNNTDELLLPKDAIEKYGSRPIYSWYIAKDITGSTMVINITPNKN